MVVQQGYFRLITDFPHVAAVLGFVFELSPGGFCSVPERVDQFFVVFERVKLVLCLFRCDFSLSLFLFPDEFFLRLAGFHSVGVQL